MFGRFTVCTNTNIIFRSIFSGDKVVVGYEAVAQADHNPLNTLYDAKRFIGKQFAIDEFQFEIERYPFKVMHFTVCS